MSLAQSGEATQPLVRPHASEEGNPLIQGPTPNFARGHSQGRPKAPPSTQNASQKSSRWGDKNKEVRGGANFRMFKPQYCTKFSQL